ncbi:secondary thiamine-phosphate synthase enzyme YjbQ [Methanobrevibacter sp. TMH8]|uniref:secondary thiamine-phosphate synthase enzyme YjbQ n=1 Tax=Methanobrevibacter sp. TMH8 TaxID=2848611 RepID=UPI001CC963C3|nr:secondary thiamine-phosphate synthase enzyme YjbQ [Methanobrevibacter sp. TMH8]
MVIFKDKIYLDTSKRTDILDITLEVEKAINESKIVNGIVNIYSKHSTSAIVVNENESGLLDDFEIILKDIVSEDNSYKHDIIDNNADSHLRALFLGPSETIPFSDKKLAFGTWQSLFFIELDGPRKRTVEVTVIGE